MKKVIFILFIVDLILFFLAYFLGGNRWVVNSQIAFITSSLVMIGSMLSYKSMVQGRLVVGAIPDDERDTLDKVEDPYDLYDDNLINNKEKNLLEVVKEERENLKKGRRTLWETTKDSKASFSFYRLFAYGLLLFGFFYLNTNKLLDIPIYLSSLFLPSILIVIVLMREK